MDLIISPLLEHFEDFSLSCLEKLGLSFSSFHEGASFLKMKGLQSRQHTSTKKTNLIPRYDETIAKINVYFLRNPLAKTLRHQCSFQYNIYFEHKIGGTACDLGKLICT